jgi:hypothetical protein
MNRADQFTVTERVAIGAEIERLLGERRGRPCLSSPVLSLS